MTITATQTGLEVGKIGGMKPYPFLHRSSLNFPPFSLCPFPDLGSPNPARRSGEGCERVWTKPGR